MKVSSVLIVGQSMKKYKRYIPILIFVLLLTVAIAPAFLASGDVGNSYSGGVSSSSGSNDSDGLAALFYYLFYIIQLLPFPFDIIVTGAIIVAVVISSNRKREDKIRTVNTGITFNDELVVTKVKAIDPNFSKYAFITYVKEAIIGCQEAIEAKDLTMVYPFSTPNFSKSLESVIKNPNTSYYQGQEILDVSFKKYQKSTTHDIIIVEAFVSEYRYQLSADNQVVSGSKTNRINEIFEMKFKRQIGQITPANGELSVSNCPKCGAPNGISSTGECSYCGSLVSNGQYSFILDSILQIPERNSIYYQKYHSGKLHTLNHEAEVVEEIQLIDPNFKLVPFEEFASTAIIEIQEAWEKRDMRLIRKFESDDLFKVHQMQIQEFIDKEEYPVIDDQKILDVNLNRFEVDGKYEYLTVIFQMHLKVYVKDKAGNVIVGNHKKDRKNGYAVRFKRSAGVLTKEGIDIKNCPNCGAPIELTEVGKCSYCESQVTSGEHGWVVDSYDAVNSI